MTNIYIHETPRSKSVFYCSVIFFSFLFLVIRASTASSMRIDYESDIGVYYMLWSRMDVFSVEFFGFYEPGFVAFMKLTHYIFSFEGFVFLVDYFLFLSFFLFCARIRRNFWFNLLFLLVLYYSFQPYRSLESVVLRQGLATAVFFFFLTYTDHASVSLRRSICWLIVMISFHTSAAMVLIALVGAKYLKGVRAFKIWFILNIMYALGITGAVGNYLYERAGFGIASLDVLKVDSDFGYTTGFKATYLLANIAFIALPVVVSAFGLIRLRLASLLGTPIFKIYFILNALSTFTADRPFSDRFFMWSWVIGPLLFVYALSFSKYQFGTRKPKVVLG